MVERDRVLNDGPKRSGGILVQSTQPERYAVALDRIAEELVHQHRVTYMLPPGTKSDGRVSIESRRKGVAVRGPSRLPEV